MTALLERVYASAPPGESLLNLLSKENKMFSALLSFLVGSVFRMIWGEFSSWLTAKQEHSHEIDRI